MSAPVTHPRRTRRPPGRRSSWWAKAWQRAVEEAAYSEKELRSGRSLARTGSVGAVTVDAGTALAAVIDGDEARTVTIGVPVLDDAARDTFVELVAAESGRIGSLLAGDLPHPLVEAVEETGVELLPYGGELAAECSCDHWLDPCPHALAVLTVLGWLVEEAPLVLLHLRGLAREELLARLHDLALAQAAGSVGEIDPVGDPAVEADLAVAEDAALRAARLLESLDGSDLVPVDGDRPR